MKPRPYQVEAIEAARASWETHRAVLLVAATGLGKTVIASGILRERAEVGRTLFLAHRGELLMQAKAKLEAFGLTCEVEKAERRASVVGGLLGPSQVVLGSMQTLRGKRLERWPRDSFATIVIDEAHRSAARTYRQILRHFDGAKVLGLTATPDRGDGVGLGGIFDACPFRYGMREGIQDGWLVPIRQQTVECADVDLSDVKTVAGDLSQEQLSRRLELDAVHHQIAGPLVELAGSRPTVVFTVSVDQAHALAGVIEGYGMSARAVDGSLPTEIREERLAAFQAGEVQCLVNVSVLHEGWDAPHVGCVAVAAPTKSRGRYCQMIGRGTRSVAHLPVDTTPEERAQLIAASPKPDCLVLDFVGNAGRHRLISPMDVLAGRPLPPDLERRAKTLAAEGLPSEEALAQAEREAVERERKAEARRRREAKVRAQVAFRAQQVDPFGIVRADSKGPRASEAQIRYLRSLGVDPKDLRTPPSKREASKLIDRLQSRRKRDLCTYKQARLLAKYGLPTELTFAAAREAIDAIAANGWKAPADLVARYQPEAAE